jgi:hypothetical protein
MSRSRHQRHGNSDILGYTDEYLWRKEHGLRTHYKKMFKWRKRKTKPFGLKMFSGWGGESYSHKYHMEYFEPVIDNGSNRQRLKNELKKEITEM